MNTKKRYKMVVPSEHQKLCDAAHSKTQEFLTKIQWLYHPRRPVLLEYILEMIAKKQNVQVRPDLIEFISLRAFDLKLVDRFTLSIEDLFIPPQKYLEDCEKCEQEMQAFNNQRICVEAEANIIFKSVLSGQIKDIATFVLELQKIGTQRMAEFGFPSKDWATWS